MEIEVQMANKYLGLASTSKYSRQNRRLSFDQEEKFFSLVRLKKYQQACDLAQDLQQQGFVSSSIMSFTTYIRANLLNKDISSSEEEESASLTSSETSQSEEENSQLGEESQNQEGEKRIERGQKNVKSKNLVKNNKPALQINKRELPAKRSDNMKLADPRRQSKAKQNKITFKSLPRKQSLHNLPQIKSCSQKSLQKKSIREEVLLCGNVHKWKHNCKNQNCPNALKRKEVFRKKKLLKIR